MCRNLIYSAKWHAVSWMVTANSKSPSTALRPDRALPDSPPRLHWRRHRRSNHDRGHCNLCCIQAAIVTTTVQVVTILTDLADIRPHDAIAPALPTYDEAVRIATERGLAREPRIGFLKQFGVAEFVPVCERIVCGTAEELDSLAAAMT